MKRVIVIGANGQLGSDLCKVFGSQKKSYSLYKFTHNDLEVTDKFSTFMHLDNIRPNIIVCTAAFHKLDLVEADPGKAFLVNSVSVKYLSEYCKQKNVMLVWFSTDYVFGQNKDRRTSYKESDSPEPINIYGISKQAGENIIKSINPDYFIIRTGELFGLAGSSGKGGNFVETMLKLYQQHKLISVVNDQYVSPTYTYNLAQQVDLLIKSRKNGLYHATSEGFCTWFQFAKEIFKQLKLKTKIIPVSSDFSDGVQRPYYSVLENSGLKSAGVNIMLNWKEALAEYLKERSVRVDDQISI